MSTGEHIEIEARVYGANIDFMIRNYKVTINDHFTRDFRTMGIALAINKATWSYAVNYPTEAPINKLVVEVSDVLECKDWDGKVYCYYDVEQNKWIYKK